MKTPFKRECIFEKEKKKNALFLPPLDSFLGKELTETLSEFPDLKIML